VAKEKAKEVLCDEGGESGVANRRREEKHSALAVSAARTVIFLLTKANKIRYNAETGSLMPRRSLTKKAARDKRAAGS